MTDIRRTILWVVFTMSLVLLWDGWNKHNGQPPMFFNTGTKPVATAASAPVSAGSAAVPAPMSSSTGAAAAPTAPVAAPIVAVPAAGVTVSASTDVLKATFDAAGASLVRLELLAHRDNVNPDRNVVLFDRSAERVYLAQTGLVGAPNLPTHLTQMQLVPGKTTLEDGVNELNLRFESPVTGGVRLVKTYTFNRASYSIAIRHEVQNQGAAPIAPQLYQQLVRDGNAPAGESSFYFTFTGPAFYTAAAKYQKVDFKDIEKGSPKFDKSTDNGWVAMVQHYFVSAWLNQEGAAREFYARKVDTNLYAVGELHALGAIEPGQSKVFTGQLYAGPQEEKKLEALAPGLDLVKDYGVFTIISKPLFWVLSWLYDLIGNWGWAIVALVVLLKALFYGLNAKAYASMAKMKAITPKITEMRERLKDKPQQMQQEMMRIYREEKVNPLGGCLPIAVQIPVFIALYWVLLSSVEMRNAPWILWITDLSAKDPFFILPVIMTATTLLQTWLNPTPADPMQARLMWIMPMVFSVMFFFFPAGLVLYWITNNVLSIAQQWVINRRLGVN